MDAVTNWRNGNCTSLDRGVGNTSMYLHPLSAGLVSDTVNPRPITALTLAVSVRLQKHSI